MIVILDSYRGAAQLTFDPLQMLKDALTQNLTTEQQAYVEKKLEIHVGYLKPGEAAPTIGRTIELARAAIPTCAKCSKKSKPAPDLKHCDHCNAKLPK